ncbi:MAG: hypothetical protein NC335_04395 [Bacteroides sp.]|nr:hypothetical protein [Bacteroides sp.]
MNRFFAIIAAVVFALTLSSCSININFGDDLDADAYLTAYYAGGLPNASANGSYVFSSSLLSDRDVDDIFHDLCRVFRPGFTDAVLEVEFYDRDGRFRARRVYDFWWEYDGSIPESGYYAWEER